MSLLPAYAAPKQKNAGTQASMAIPQNQLSPQSQAKTPNGKGQQYVAPEGAEDGGANPSPYVSDLSDVSRSLSQSRQSMQDGNSVDEGPSVQDLLQESKSRPRKHTRKEIQEYDVAQARQQLIAQLGEIDARHATVIEHIIAIKAQLLDSWSADIQALQNNVASAVSNAISSVQSSAVSTTDQIRAAMAAKRAEVEQSKQGSISEITNTASQESESISTLVQNQGQLLREAGGQASSAAENMGSTEIKRAEDQIGQQKEQAESIGRQSIQGIHDEDPDLADAKREAVTETVEEVTDNVQEGLEPMQELAEERSEELSPAMAGVGSQAADELVAGIEPATAAFNDQAVQASGTIDQFAGLSIDQLDSLERQSLQQVETLAASAIGQLEPIQQLVGAQCEAALNEAKIQIESQVTQVVTDLDSEIAGFRESLSSIERPDPSAIRMWIDSALGGLTASESEIVEQLEIADQNAQDSLSEESTKAESQIMDLVDTLDGELSNISQAGADAAEGPIAATNEGIATISNSFAGNMELATTTAETEVTEGVGQTVEGINGTTNETRDTLAKKVDEGLQTNRQLVDGLPSAVASAITTAEEQYDESWWETGLRWAGSALSWVGDKIVSIGKALVEMAKDPGFWAGLLLGVGLAILAAGTIASGGLLAVAVAGAIGAASAAYGTIVSNVYHGRPWHENVIRNAFIGLVAAGGAVAGPMILGGLMSEGAAAFVGLEVATGGSTIIANAVEGKPLGYQVIESMAIAGIFFGAAKGAAWAKGKISGGTTGNPSPEMPPAESVSGTVEPSIETPEAPVPETPEAPEPVENIETDLQREVLEEFAEAQERYGGAQEETPIESENGAANLDEPGRIPEMDPGYDPNWEPEGPHRFPAKNKGEWIEGGPGDGRWQPHDPGAYGLEPGQSVPFREGVPDFTEYAVDTPSGQPGTFEVEGLTGNGSQDYATAVQELAAQEGMTFRECQQWLGENGLRLHHFSGNEMQIVPERLHGALGHQGSAVELRP